MKNPAYSLQSPICRYRSPLRYPGGKQKALSQIAACVPSSASEYREPLVGGGSVYFHARTINLAKHYWINDAFSELISFWRIVQNKDTCRRLIKDLEKLKSDYSSADELKQFFHQVRFEQPAQPAQPAFIEEAMFEKATYRQALLFFFFNRVTFSGTTKAGGFSSSASLQRFTASSIQRLKPMPEALSDTKITNFDFEEVINYPGEDVFLFLDPPYFTANKLYGNGGNLHSFDHERLANALRCTNHRFLITYDDCDEIRALYKWAKIKNWQLQYGMNNCNLKHKSKIGAELFISNY